MATTTKALRRAVERGCNLLDLYYADAIDPRWETSLDLEVLDIGDGGRCVLGQKFGHFLHGAHILDIWGTSTTYYGFAVHCVEDRPRINAAWRAAIQHRRERKDAV